MRKAEGVTNEAAKTIKSKDTAGKKGPLKRRLNLAGDPTGLHGRI